jgi:E3 ubiquitin-protein ligase HERC1
MLRDLGEEIVQISCGFRHSLMLSENGKVFGMGMNRGHEMGLGTNTQPKFYSPVRITALEMYMIIKIAAGSFSGAITSSREAVIWGSGEFGILALP